jgi:hypothetical protein
MRGTLTRSTNQAKSSPRATCQRATYDVPARHAGSGHAAGMRGSGQTPGGGPSVVVASPGTGTPSETVSWATAASTIALARG